MAGNGFGHHIALKTEEIERLRVYGATLGAPLSPRQVLLHLLTQAERAARRAKKREESSP